MASTAFTNVFLSSPRPDAGVPDSQELTAPERRLLPTTYNPVGLPATDGGFFDPFPNLLCLIWVMVSYLLKSRLKFGMNRCMMGVALGKWLYSAQFERVIG